MENNLQRFVKLFSATVCDSALMCTKMPMVSSTIVFAPLQQMAVCTKSL